jgi:hypothetical protein
MFHTGNAPECTNRFVIALRIIEISPEHYGKTKEQAEQELDEFCRMLN